MGIVRRLASILFVASITPLAAQEGMTLEFAETSLRVTGATPGAQVFLIGAGRSLDGYQSQIVQGTAARTDDDRDGEVELEILPVIPDTSVWVAIDAATGEWATLSSGIPAPEVVLESGRISLEFGDPEGEGKLILSEGSLLEALLIRPEVGAWSARHGGRFGPLQAPGGDAAIALELADLFPLGQTVGAVEHFEPGDLLVVLDPDRLELWLRLLTQEDFEAEKGS